MSCSTIHACALSFSNCPHPSHILLIHRKYTKLKQLARRHTIKQTASFTACFSQDRCTIPTDLSYGTLGLDVNTCHYAKKLAIGEQTICGVKAWLQTRDFPKHNYKKVYEVCITALLQEKHECALLPFSTSANYYHLTKTSNLPQLKTFELNSSA